MNKKLLLLTCLFIAQCSAVTFENKTKHTLKFDIEYQTKEAHGEPGSYAYGFKTDHETLKAGETHNLKETDAITSVVVK